MYQKPYPEYFDEIQCPPGYKIPDFVTFSGDGTKTTWEHISQYLAQLGEVASSKELKIRLFPLSLTGTAFSWFHLCRMVLFLHGLILNKNFMIIFTVVIMNLKLSH